MNCTSCGANLPQGATACPLCGTPTPYNAARSGSSPQYDPTVASSQPGSGNPPQYDPTIPAQPYGGTPPPPSTAYGSPSYGTPPPNPYDASNPYASPPPPQQNYYGAPNQQQAGYAPVAPQSQQGGMYGTQPPPKRRSRLGLILGIIALVLILAGVGIFFAVYQGIKPTGNTVVTPLNATATAIEATVTASSNTTPTTSTNTTPTTSTNTTPTTSSSGAPSGLAIDSTAAGIVTNVQMASAVDSNFSPTKTSSTFVAKQTIYATFKTNANAPDGYVEGKWYSDGKYAFSSKILAVKADFLGYLSAEYNIATQGTVEMYWCTQSDCSDAKLADVANFTVTSTSMRGTPPPALAFMDINRP